MGKTKDKVEQARALGRKVFNQYEGEIEETKYGLKITARNLLKDERKIECKVDISILESDKYPFSVGADEQTYSIIGGCGVPCSDLKEAEKEKWVKWSI